jgi:O-antigen ligase
LSPERYLAKDDLYLALGALTLYSLVALNLTSSKWRGALVTFLLALATVNCAIGVVQYFTHHAQTPLQIIPLPEYIPRIGGFYGYPNHLAGFLEITLMLGLSMAFWSRWPVWGKLLCAYICLMCLAAIVATGSRSGYIACTLGLLVFSLLSLVLVGKLAPGRIIGFFFAGLILLAAAGLGAKMLVAKNFQLHWRAEKTLTIDVTRVRLWQAAWQQFRLHPAIGTGSGTYSIYGRQFRSPALQTDPVHAHSDYFELLAEYGIVGLIAAVIFLETHLRTGWTSFRRRLSDRGGTGMNSNSLALNVGALAATAACLVHCMLDFTLHNGANVLVMAFVFALLGSPGAGPEAAHTEEESGSDFPAFLRLALPVLGVIITLGVLPSAPAEYYAERARILLTDWHVLTEPEVAQRLQSLAQRGLNFAPRNPELYFYLGRACSSLADLSTDPSAKEEYRNQAIAAFDKAVEFAPRDENYILLKADELDAAKRFAEADPLFDRALELDPKSSNVINALARHLERQGKLDAAIGKYREAMRLGGGMVAQLGLERIAEEQKAKGPGAAPEPESPRPN